MRVVLSVLSWLFAIVLILMAVALWFLGGPLQAVLVGLAALCLLPVLWRMLKSYGFALSGGIRVLAALVLVAGMVAITATNPASSIYKSPEVRQQMEALYRDKLAKWPVPVEELFVDTSYGRIHVLVSGPETAPPLLLIHASALSAWSWLPNIEALAADHRVYAPDNLGEIGLNQQADVNMVPTTGTEIAGFIVEITDGLGIGKADVVGASIGGFIATTYALEKPDRVGRLALLGSMGYGNTSKTIALMVMAQAFPLPMLQDWTMGWALGDSEAVASEYGEWFRLVLNGTAPKPIPPVSFTPEHLARLSVPVLAMFGTEDEVIGSADAAVALAANIPDVRTIVVDSGHLIGAELPERTNAELVAFLGDKADASPDDPKDGTKTEDKA